MTDDDKDRVVGSWYATYYSILALPPSDSKPIFPYERDEPAIHAAISGIASIVSSAWWRSRPASAVRHPNALGPLAYVRVLLNIVDLPICFSRRSRCNAIHTIGQLARHPRLRADADFDRLIVRIAHTFAARQATAPDFLRVAYIFALGRMAANNQQLQNVLVRHIRELLPDLSKVDETIQIAVCKAIATVEQPTEEMAKRMSKLSQSREVSPDVSAYASAALTCLMHRPSDLGGIAARLEESLRTTDSRNVQKACLKALEAMASEDPEFWPRGQEILLEFVTGRSRSSRDCAFKRLTRLALKWGDESLVATLLTYGLGHINIRRKSSTPFLSLVLDAVCSIGRRMTLYRGQVIDSLKKVLETSIPCPGSVFVTFLDLAQPKGDGEKVRRIGSDIFAEHEIEPPWGDDTRLIYEWKQSRSRVLSLYQLDLTVEDLGNTPVKHRVLDPKGKAFQLYMDVVARYTVAISAPLALAITVPSFLDHLKDPVRGDRTPCLWETIQAMMTEHFATVNYVQLLYAVALTKRMVEVSYFQSLLVDLYESWKDYRDRQQSTPSPSPKTKKDVPFKSQPFRPHPRQK